MKISDEAQKLVKLLCLPNDPVWLAVAQTAINDAYNRGLEVVEKYYAEKIKAYADMPDSMMKSFALDVFKMSADDIRAMKVKP